MNGLAVIPSFAVYGPLALLALLMPTLFGGILLGFKRWTCALVALSAMSVIVFAHAFVRGSRDGLTLQNRALYWIVLAGIAAVFAAMSGIRHRKKPTSTIPNDLIVLGCAAIVSLGLALWSAASGATVVAYPTQELLVAGSASAAAFLALILAARARCLPTELVWLTAMAVGCVAAASHRSAEVSSVDPDRIVWSMPLGGRGMIAGAPIVAGDEIVVGLAESSGFQSNGQIVAVQRSESRIRRRFGDDVALRPVFSTPRLFGSLLYFGEGLHSDHNCRVHCIDFATGTKVWDHVTTSHVESSPAVDRGRVFVGAGDDGLICLDAATGNRIWQFGGLHVDASPAVHADRVYAGSTGTRGGEVFALAAADGKPVWRVPIDLQSFARPAVRGETIYFSLHSGDFETRAAEPAGAVLAMNAANGQRIWRTDLPDAVFTEPLVDRDSVIVGCRDGSVYSLQRTDGSILWKRPMDSPVLASPAGAGTGNTLAAIYVASRGGSVARLDPADGRIVWSVEIAGANLMAPPVVVQEPGGRRIYIAGSGNSSSGAARLFCLSDDD